MSNENEFKSLAEFKAAETSAISDLWEAYQNKVEASDEEVDAVEFLDEQSSGPRAHCFKPAADAHDPITFNLTAQAALVRKVGEAQASVQLARHGLKLGQVRDPAEREADLINKPTSNPWHDRYPKKDAAEQRLAVIRRNTSLARSLAAAAGKRIDGSPLPKR